MAIVPRKQNHIIEQIRPINNELNNNQVRESLNTMIESKSKPIAVKNDITTVQVHGEETIIARIKNKQKDLLDPPRFRNNKPIKLQEDDPEPYMTKPAKKLTKEEESQWTIPPCVSNWKNPAGHIIPMEVRISSDPRKFEQPQMSAKFSAFNRSLEGVFPLMNEDTMRKNNAEIQMREKQRKEEEEAQEKQRKIG